MSWTAIAVFAAGSYLLKAAGPILLSERARVPLNRLALLVTPALLAALVAVQTFADGQTLVFDERSVGFASAIAAILLRAPFAIVLVVAAATTAIARML